MRTTIYLPDHLAKRLQAKLDEEGKQNLSQFIQKAVEKELAQKDISHFLAFTGAVKSAPKHADQEAEDF
ncbi:hypothetical protein PCC7418_3550 [Halothece sp. PCC 7418]|uniref:CopG family ribbon-helix-helix protein n=1 Tax=Halothece sp. (strain PCC 7418) TaxID=65093 RepID=UPI0002A0609B|nr:ribbon-helix-helix domain-containing protein [Halothece sp. PCC 7418]AFZ45661.1 hypothetical protein PCC7418_3550 [Halothece sp. PCC 7418]